VSQFISECASIDCMTGFCKQYYSIDFRLPVRNSPILPNGLPKPKPKEKIQLRHFHSIKRGISSLIFRDSKIQQQRGKRNVDARDQKIYANLGFERYFRDRCRLEDFRSNAEIFTNADVIAISFDRSKPETLHNAIYKVRIFTDDSPFRE
jgi:hypothetical protein